MLNEEMSGFIFHQFYRNILGKFETREALTGLGLTGDACNALLTEAISKDTIPVVTHLVCNTAIEILAKTTRQLN